VTHPNSIPEHFITHSAQEGTVTTNDITPDFRTPAADPAKPKNGAATAALVLGIIGLALFVVPVANVLLAGTAFALAIVGMKRAKRIHVGSGKAVAGLTLSIVALLGGFISTMAMLDAADEPQVVITQEAGPGISEPEAAEEPAAEPEEPKAEPEPAPEPAPEPEEPSLTVAQEQAVISADSYLYGLGGFSRESLIGQLEFEGFSTEDATFAADVLDVDWNAQAQMSAESYMQMGGFSAQSLLDQLLYEGFTQEQAEYGVRSVGF
jgi:hypothetical protein